MKLSRNQFLASALITAVIGVILMIFGAVYTLKTNDTIGTYYGYPIWSPPMFPGAPNNVTMSTSYLVNYIGIALLLASVISLLLWNQKKPKESTTETVANSAVTKSQAP
jgi:hypothetical protein